jgi:hypothetical protein
MKVDSTIADVILSTSKTTGVDKEKVLDMIDKYYEGIQEVVQNTTPAVIKIDYFGKLIYNHAWRAKAIEGSLKKKANEVV